MKFAAAVKVIGSPIPGNWKYSDTISDTDGKNVIGIPLNSFYFLKFDLKEQR